MIMKLHVRTFFLELVVENALSKLLGMWIIREMIWRNARSQSRGDSRDDLSSGGISSWI